MSLLLEKGILWTHRALMCSLWFGWCQTLLHDQCCMYEVPGYVTTYIIRIPRRGIRAIIAMEALCRRLNCCLIKWTCFRDGPASGKSDRKHCTLTTCVSRKSDECR